MAEFKVRTHGGSDPHGKPRVYFTCHPEDFDRYFDKVCEDVFKTQDCAIYYTADMSEPLDEVNRNVDLGRVNLLLVPVTFRLMNEPCRAMSVDIAYAKEKNIPILPFMMESGIDAVYSLPKNFGERQYLSPFSTDTTEVSYAEKLKKILEAILISDKMANRVRAAFDAYVFLSYRKKDRRYANELMRIIHNIPGCRDIAIWYDEFLTPSESWRENIKHAMEMVQEKSNLFTLLVTPNLLEEYLDENGNLKKNFVMETEYPKAREMGMDILPTEMVETDRDELNAKYDGIPEPVKSEDEHFTDTLLSVIEKIAISENDQDPEHNFLIGLAYLDGIDVEVDVERGLSLITMAAEVGLPEAMEKLFDMYCKGDRVPLDYHEALKWAKSLFEYTTREYGEESLITIHSLEYVAFAYDYLGEYKKALEIKERVYELRCRVQGTDDPETNRSLNNIAYTYGLLNDYKKAIEIYEELMERKGWYTSLSLIVINNLAFTYNQLGNHKRALELFKILYEIQRKDFGDESEKIIKPINNLAYTYSKLTEYEKAFELYEKAYALSLKIHGKKHPQTINALNSIAFVYSDLKDFHKALDLKKEVYTLYCETLCENHPQTLISLVNLGAAYSKVGEHAIALELTKKAYEKLLSIWGEDNPMVITSLHNIAWVYEDSERFSEAHEINLKVYEARRRILGEEHIDTIKAFNHLALSYFYIREYDKSLEIYKESYALSVRVLGEDHPVTKSHFTNLENTFRVLAMALSQQAFVYKKIGNYQTAVLINLKVWEMYRAIYKEDHPETLSALNNLASSYRDVGDFKKAAELYEKVYEMRCKVLGKDNEKTLITIYNLAYTYELLDEKDKAIALLDKTYDLFIEVLGETNNLTLKVTRLWQRLHM